MIYYTTGRLVERPAEHVDRPPQRADFRTPAGAPRESLRGLATPRFRSRGAKQHEAVRWRTLCGGGAGFLGPRFDPFCVNGDPAHLTDCSRSAALEVTAGGRAGGSCRCWEAARLSPTNGYRELRDQASRHSAGGARAGVHLDGEPMRQGTATAAIDRPRFMAGGWPRPGADDRGSLQRDDSLRRVGRPKNFEGLKGTPAHCRSWAFGALEDLADRGLLDTTLAVVMGEFAGRRRSTRTRAATTGSSVGLAGGGIRGGQVVGPATRSGVSDGRPLWT